VLFLDELTEFHRDAVEGLRQPLEDGRVVVTRASGTVEFPARFTLVAAANPCPCGFDGDPRRACRCPPNRIELYRSKLSGPLLDRIDLRLPVPRLARSELLGESTGEPSSAVRDRVEEARGRQRTRYRGTRVRCNGQLSGPAARRTARLDGDGEALLARAVDRLLLTGRGVDRALKVARTIADLEGSEMVTAGHLGEALSYRIDLAEPEAAHAV
jgi:magnesium chelatase family protein